MRAEQQIAGISDGRMVHGGAAGPIRECLVGNTVSTSQRARRTASVHVRLRDKDTVAVEDKRLSNLQRDRERNFSEERDYSHFHYLSVT